MHMCIYIYIESCMCTYVCVTKYMYMYIYIYFYLYIRMLYLDRYIYKDIQSVCKMCIHINVLYVHSRGRAVLRTPCVVNELLSTGPGERCPHASTAESDRCSPDQRLNFRRLPVNSPAAPVKYGDPLKGLTADSKKLGYGFRFIYAAYLSFVVL